MTKTKTTKRALLLSALSLLLCVSMLVGSTFAWFTDSVTSAGNIIQSGTLDVDLVDALGNSLEGKVLKFVDQDTNSLWEPGCTYSLQEVYVANLGNLALKYEIVINGINGNAKLLEAIDWTVTVNGQETALADLKGELQPNTKTGPIVLTGHMREDAGNEYQDLTAEGISIAVFATQLASESDSFTNQYDADAEYAAQTMLKDVAAVAAGESATVKLESDGYIVINDANLVGAKVTGNVTLDLNGKTLFVKVEDGNGQKSLFNIVKGGKLTVTGDGTIQMVSGANNLVTAIFNNTAGTLVIENGTYKMDYPNDWQVSLIPTIIDTNSSAGYAVTTINGGNFYHTRNMFRNFTGVKSELIINGGTFNGKADDWAAIWNQKPSASVPEGNGIVTVNGGTFNYVEINNEFETGVTVSPSVIIPIPVSTLEELQNAVNNAKDGDVILLTSDITGNVTLPRKENVNYTIDGNGKTFNGLVSVEGHCDTGSLTIKNIKFIAATGAESVIVSNTMYTANGTTYNNYVKNLIIENCTFTDADGDQNCAAVRANGGGKKNWTLKNLTVDSTMHSLYQGGNVQTGLVIDGCVINSKNGVNVQTGYSLEMNNCTFDVQGYCVRIGAKSTDIAVYEYTIKNSTLKSACAEAGDALIEIRATAVKSTFNLENNTMIGSTEILGATADTIINKH